LPMELPSIPPRRKDAHKGDFGKNLIIGGSRAMPGAASLAGAAALRAGAGLVKIALPLSAAAPVAAVFPCYTLLPCLETDEGTLAEEALHSILQAAEEADVVALGPGLGTHPATARLAIKVMFHCAGPLVIDADGLTMAAMEPAAVQRRKPTTVLTPHPGEFMRLAKTKTPPSEDKRLDAAKELARRFNAIVLLKGYRTVVTDGKDYHVVETGNPGMATAGSGDVLTGVITSLLHSIDDPLGAVALGAEIHAAAGDIAAESFGQISMTAADILNHLPQAIAASNG